MMKSTKYTVDNDKEVVVFILGMRIFKLLYFPLWIPIIKQMGVMLQELYTNKETGFLHSEFMFSWRGITLLQYWESYDALEAYAHGDNHMISWKHYNRRVSKRGAVGVFHETYRIDARQYESIYVNMPKFGLANVFPTQEITSENKRSRDRMG